MHTCAQNCTTSMLVVHQCAQMCAELCAILFIMQNCLCTSVQKFVHICTRFAQVCTSVHKYATMCTSMHKCTPVCICVSAESDIIFILVIYCFWQFSASPESISPIRIRNQRVPRRYLLNDSTASYYVHTCLHNTAPHA